MPNSTVPAAATGLPTNIIAFPIRRPTIGDFMPDASKMQQALTALCVSWQFADLDDEGMDAALAEMIKIDRRRHGAMLMVRENKDAIRHLYEATDFLMDMDQRLQESLARVLDKLEARQ